MCAGGVGALLAIDRQPENGENGFQAALGVGCS